MIRLVFLITAIRSHIEIHSDVGVTTQEINDAYITRRDYQRLKVYVPVEFRLPPGPLKAETQARLHEELVDLHDKLGLDDYVVLACFNLVLFYDQTHDFIKLYSLYSP